MSVYFDCSYFVFPQVVARYVCRCGRIHAQHGALHVSKLPPGWHEITDVAGEPQPECPRCHQKTLARRAARQP